MNFIECDSGIVRMFGYSPAIIVYIIKNYIVPD